MGEAKGITNLDDYCVYCGYSQEYIQKFQMEKDCENATSGHRYQSEVDELRDEVKLKEMGHL